MTLSTYGGLKAALAGLLNRDDLSEAIPDFVALFEADFDADPATARQRRRICRASATIASEYETLPSNYLAVQTVTLEGEPPRRLRYLDPDSLARLIEAAPAAGADEPPRHYSIVGLELRFHPVPPRPMSCQLTVYERLEPLTADTDANWLLTYFPGVYLYGAALHSAPYLGADERLATWKGLYDEALAKLAAADPPPTSQATLRTEMF